MSFFNWRCLHGWCQKATAANKEREMYRAATKNPFMDNLQFFEETYLKSIEGRVSMIVAEYHSDVSIVRIHDEYCLMNTEQCLKNVSSIVSDFYKRRQLDSREKYVAAMQSGTNSEQKKLV